MKARKFKLPVITETKFYNYFDDAAFVHVVVDDSSLDYCNQQFVADYFVVMCVGLVVVADANVALDNGLCIGIRLNQAKSLRYSCENLHLKNYYFAHVALDVVVVVVAVVENYCFEIGNLCSVVNTLLVDYY